MYEEIFNWITALLPPGRYTLKDGQWTEDAADAALRFAVVQIDGGPAVNVDLRRKDVRVILLGQRNARQDTPMVLDDIESLLQAALAVAAPCGAAHTRVMSEPSRPGYTTEDRAFTMLDFQIIF